MRVSIPARFTMMNRRWTVRLGTDLKKGVDGECRYEHAEIVLRPGMDKKYTEHTFLHELSHCIAGALGWETFNADEGKIDALGGALHQFLQTKTGKLE